MVRHEGNPRLKTVYSHGDWRKSKGNSIELDINAANIVLESNERDIRCLIPGL